MAKKCLSVDSGRHEHVSASRAVGIDEGALETLSKPEYAGRLGTWLKSW